VLKGKVVAIHAMKAYQGNGGIAPLFCNFRTRQNWLVSLTPWPFYPQGKSPHCLLNRRLGGPQILSGCLGEEMNLLPILGFKHQIVQHVAQFNTQTVYLQDLTVYL